MEKVQFNNKMVSLLDNMKANNKFFEFNNQVSIAAFPNIELWVKVMIKVTDVDKANEYLQKHMFTHEDFDNDIKQSELYDMINMRLDDMNINAETIDIAMNDKDTVNTGLQLVGLQQA